MVNRKSEVNQTVMSTEKIRVAIDPDLQDLIPGFLENRGKDLGKMREALLAEDLEILRSIGHSLKGVGGGYGFHRISEIGAAIETSAKASDLDSITPQLDNLADYLERLEVVYE